MNNSHHDQKHAAEVTNEAWRPALIEGHGLISDGQTAALVYEDATIDWLCMPRFDSEACFAALLGTADNGGWWLSPVAEVTGRSRRYVGETLVLETVFETAKGEVAILDFMPTERQQAPDIVRIVEGRRGSVEMASRLALRFDHGRTHPMVQSHEDGEMVAIAGPNAVVLRFDAPIDHSARAFTSRFTVRKGERRALTMTWFASHEPLPDPVDPAKALEQARKYWTDWANQTDYDGIAAPIVRRSLLTLKALVHARTGGMLAAATSSLPERPGGTRNWDYRFCWLRDAAFTLVGFLNTGHVEEARAWIAWLRRALAGEPIDVQPFYGIDGTRHSLEWQAEWLQGFGDAQPVRFGNGAIDQLQLDIYGEVIDTLCIARTHGLSDHTEDADALIALLVEKLETIWRQPDAGIWEERGPLRHHVYSKAMCWVAFHRAATTLFDSRPDAARRWGDLADEVRAEVLSQGYDADRGAFTGSYGEAWLDAAVLRLPIVGFIEADDPRMIATVAAIERELMRDGLVYRYSAETVDDGVGGGEGMFIAVACWLADVYAMQGRQDDARALFDRVTAAANDLGLLSEEWWAADGRAMGNFPQALSHVALVNTALALDAGGRPPRHPGNADNARSAS
jgi:GH15 family glucan-1,4-alpha-glucosidase